MSIKLPPSSLATPRVETLAKGEVIHRLHQSRLAATSFNPCRGNPTRFAPIRDDLGACVPSLYAGATLGSAIHETIFHDVAAKATFKTVRRREVLIRTHTVLEVARDLVVASLRNVDLARWSISRRELIESGPKLYNQTAQWAAAVHHGFSQVEGLVWTSRQCDPDSVYLFFGDRVAATDLTVVSARDGATDRSFMRDVRSEGRRRGIVITV